MGKGTFRNTYKGKVEIGFAFEKAAFGFIIHRLNRPVDFSIDKYKNNIPPGGKFRGSGNDNSMK